MIKSILTSLLFINLVFSQQRQTVYVTLTPTPITSSNLGTTTYFIQNNIGQTFHTVSAIVVDTGSPGSCGSQATNVGLAYGLAGEIEASFNGTSYFQLPQKTTTSIDSINNTQSKIYRATTAYPFIRFKIIALSLTVPLPAGCGISLFYSGSLDAGYLNDSIYTNSSSVFPINLTNRPIATTCSGLLSANGSNTNTLIGLYGLILTNPNSAAITVNLYYDSACTTVVHSFNVLGNSTLFIQPDLYPDNFAFFQGSVGIFATSSTASSAIPYFQFLN